MSLIKAIENGNLAQVQELIASGIDVNNSDDYDIPLCRAVDLSKSEIVEALIEAGASMETENDSPLERAVWNGDQKIVEILIKHYLYNQKLHPYYSEALMVASIRGNCEIVSLLLESGIDINSIIGQSGTALHYAAERGQIKVAKLLIAADADVNCPNTSEEAGDNKNETPLMSAATNNEEIFNLLLDADANVNIQDSEGTTPLMILAQSNRIDLPSRLIAAGVDVNAKNTEGRTALIIAADNGNSAVVKLLIEAGADIDAIDNTGNTALTYAEKDYLEAFQNPTETATNEEIFCQSERYRQTEQKQQNVRRRRIAEYLKNAGASIAGLKNLALVKAVIEGKLGEVEALIDTGANVNAIAPRKGTPLFQAVSQENKEIVETLLTEGADSNLTYDGNCPLIEAAKKGNIELVEMLLNAGANPHITDSNDKDWEGDTALDHAQISHHKEIVELLRKKGKRKRQQPISEWRGLVSNNLNDRLILVKANVEQVAAAFCEVRNASIWLKNAFEKEVELTNLCYKVFQFTGHQWTNIHETNCWSWKDSLDTEDAKELSKKLQTQAIYYGVSDTAGVIYYELFESGELIELFDDGSDCTFPEEKQNPEQVVYGNQFKFYSKQRQIDAKTIKNVFDFVDEFFKSQNAYVPAFGNSGRICGTGQSRILSIVGLDPEDLRLDYVAVKN